MRCPLCTSAMSLTPGRSVELDRCDGCSAVFFDVGELCRHLQTGARMEENLRRAADGAAGGAGCARCGTATAAIETTSGLVQVCRGCGGVLLPAAVAEVARQQGLLPKPGVAHSIVAPKRSSDGAMIAAEIAIEGAFIAAELGPEGVLAVGELAAQGTGVLLEVGAEASAGAAEVLFEGLLELFSFS